MSSSTRVSYKALALIAALSIIVLLQFGLDLKPSSLQLSSWRAAAPISGEAVAQPEAAEAVAAPAPIGEAALQLYNQGSALQEEAAGGAVQFYRRDVNGGRIAYFVVRLDQHVHIEVINADGATPGSDATGDTVWMDGAKHLATVAAMAQAPYATRDGMTLLGAMAFGFHGDVRTSDEGSIVVNGTVHRVNAGRSVVCVRSDGSAQIGLFDTQALGACEQAAGAGPIILWRGKIANTAVQAETAEFVPFNPLGENFVQISWRKQVYNGAYPKTAIGVGPRAGGGSYLVMVISEQIAGVTLAEQLRAMGCTDALGGDDDSSTQAAWRGAPVWNRAVRTVPDAVAVYEHQ